MKRIYYILAATLMIGVAASCSKEKECKCYLPENVITYETAEECRFLNLIEVWNDTSIVMKYCLEE